MDMEAGYAKVILGTPAEINVAGLADDLDGAGYTLKTLELEAEGTVVSGTCKACGEVNYLELEDTKQRFELSGPAESGAFNGFFEGWDGDHLTLEPKAPDAGN